VPNSALAQPWSAVARNAVAPSGAISSRRGPRRPMN
jgi:CBS-domain-containing membrane protein